MFAIPIILGTLMGVGMGVLLGRSKVCTRAGCDVRNNRIASILAGAIFGAVAGYYVARRMWGQ
jgi:hypothetical protein